MCRTDVIAQSKWLADAREEIAAGLRSSDDAWLKDMSLRWGCRLAMLVADFGVRVMLHHDGINMRLALDSASGRSAHDRLSPGDDTAGNLASAASIKLPRFEEIALATVEANASTEIDPHMDKCIDTILTWRQMVDATRNSTPQSADSYISQTCQPLLRQFMGLASCATAGRPFELCREGDYEDAWCEFEHFCIDPCARPATPWGQKYRKTQWIEFRQPSLYARQDALPGFNRWASRHTMITESPSP